jgi:serine/threonine protein kinase
MLGQILLGKYQVSRRLDRGGMCDIWLGRQLDIGREAVVKVLQEPFARQAKPREFLRREIHILSRFRHANVVAFYDAAPHEANGPILVVEYLRGIDLSLLLRREGRIMPERAGRLLAQLCDALGEAHKAGIVHRDIKPGNLMIVHPGTPQETVKLMDFGLAKMASLLYIGADEVGDCALPAASGTPEYLAPEQALGRELDGRGDLYSVGVVLYEMLSGRRPFERDSAEELLQAHLHEKVPTFAARGVEDIPPPVEAVVRSCLAKHPEDRPCDAAELFKRFEDAVGKRLSAPRRGSSGLFNIRPNLSAPPPVEAPSRLPSTPMSSSERHALRHDFEADMPEAMAMLKIKGFLHDLGGSAIQSEPGLIRVRLGDAEPAKKKSGLFGLLDRGGRKFSAIPLAATATEIELRMERRDLGQPNRLYISLVMRSRNGLITAEWRTHCQKIARDLKAYLMGR